MGTHQFPLILIRRVEYAVFCSETMASSKKSKKGDEHRKKNPRSNGARETNGGNTKNSGANGKTTTNKKQSEMNGDGAVDEREVFEISDSSSDDSEEEGGGEEEPRSSKGGGKSRNAKGVGTPKRKRRKEEGEEEEDGICGGVEGAKLCTFPMNRIRRIMKTEDSASQIMQDAVFLVNKATVSSFSE